MSIQKLATKFTTGAWILNVKEYFKKINEIIDYLNGTGSSGSGSYKKYIGIASQSGTDAPVVLVMENTLGATITWTYDNVGSYYGTASSAIFTTDKTWFIIGNQADLSTVTSIRNSTTQIQISTFSDVATQSNNMMFDTPIEIRVYN